MKFATDELQRSAALPTWAEYVQFTHETASYPFLNARHHVPSYPRDGLIEEIGEIFGVRAKMHRDDLGVWTMARLEHLCREIGDALWMLARISIHEQWGDKSYEAIASVWTGAGADHEALEHAMQEAISDYPCYVGVLMYLADFAAEHNITLQQAAAVNMSKLRDRKARGVIQGKGDHR